MRPKVKLANPTPLTTAQSLGSLIKSARNIMRKDKGLNGDLDRLPLLTWIMFLKFLDDLERQREEEATLEGKRFRPAIDRPYRWRDWAANAQGVTGNELLAFINNEECTHPDGKRGPGLFAYLRQLTSVNGDDRRDVIATVFKGVDNRMKSGYLLRDVVNKVAGINFTSSEELHTLGALYETMLREMRDAAGDSGEFYTPRPVVRFMVELVDPRLGESVLDPASGTGGFLVESLSHLAKQVRTVADRQALQERTLSGCEPKPLPYLLCQMNLLLHGLNAPRIDPGNALRFKLSELGERDRVDVILTNPPFGGEEERGIQGNFPDDKRTAETTLLFLQLIMRRLRRSSRAGAGAARAAVVVPNGVLSSPGVARLIREDLLRDFNLHTIVRLPHNVFAPYTDIKTNLLFFDRTTSTSSIFYCEPELPRGVTLSKTKPLKYEWLRDLQELIRHRRASDRSWVVDRATLGEEVDLDVKNPKLRLDSVGSASDGLGRLDEHLNAALKSIAQTREELGSVIGALRSAPLAPLGEFTDESDARVGQEFSAWALRGVSAESGLTAPKGTIGSAPERYKVLRLGFLAYNPMRINIGSIGVVRRESEVGIISPDYVVFTCRPGVLPEYVYHFLRSASGRHEINLKTKGSVRFRLYYNRLAQIQIPVPIREEDQGKFVELCNRLEDLRWRLRDESDSVTSVLDAATREAFLKEQR